MNLSYSSKIFFIFERDLRILFHDKISLVLMFMNFAIDLFVSGVTFSQMITGFNYFLFIAPGATLVTAGTVAFQSGREIFLEKALRDLSPYHLTLPVPRYLYVAARMAAGVIKSIVATAPGTIVLLVIYSPTTPSGIVGPFLVIALFALAGAALSVMAAIVSKRTEVFITLRSTIQLYLTFLSTAFYPLEFIPAALVPLTLVNPKTWAVQAFRHLVQEGSVPLQDILALALTSVFLATLAAAAYLRTTRI
ncbi:MAG: ABC transporter permease [Thaumarchaeota archaeon]|nr:ABC transporter permease [Nitrososphaerota archaeon]